MHVEVASWKAEAVGSAAELHSVLERSHVDLNAGAAIGTELTSEELVELGVEDATNFANWDEFENHRDLPHKACAYKRACVREDRMAEASCRSQRAATLVARSAFALRYLQAGDGRCMEDSIEFSIWRR